MMSISHWGLFCCPAKITIASIQELHRLAKQDEKRWFPAAPSDFYFGPHIESSRAK
jgi:hypothetical protein